MRSFSGFWVVVCGLGLLAGCVGSPVDLPPTAAPSAAVVLQRRSPTPSPTRAESSQPAVTATPGQVEPARLLTPIVSAPGALDAESAAHLVEVARWGMGMPLEMVWSPGCGGQADSDTAGQCWLALATTRGIYRFASDRFVSDHDATEPSGKMVLQDVFESALPVSSLAWSPGCGLRLGADCWLAAGFENGGLRLWDAYASLQDEPSAVLQNGDLPLRSLAWSPECKKSGMACQLAAGAWDGTIYLWNIEGETLTVRPLRSDRGSVDKLAFNSDTGALLSWSPGELIQSWDVETGTVEDSVMGGGATARVAFSLNGAVAALIGLEGGLRVQDAGNGYTLYALSPPEIKAHNASISGDGSVMAVQEGEVMRLRDAADGRTRLTLRLPGAAIPGRMALTQDGSWLAAAGPGVLWVWHTAGTQLATELRVGRGLDHLALSVDGNLLATWRDTAVGVGVWQLDEGSSVGTLSGMPLPPLAAAFSADCSESEDCLLATAADALRVWDVSGLRPLHELYAETLGAEYRLTFYDLDSGQTNVTTLRDQTPLASAAFSPDGRLVAAGGYDGTVRLWALEDGQAVGTLAVTDIHTAGEDARVVRVGFSDDSRLVGGLTSGGSAAVWEVDSGALQGQFSLDLPDVLGIDDVCYFAFEGENLAVGWEGETQVIDLPSAQLLEARPGWCGLSLHLSPDGMIASGGGLLQLEEPGESYPRREGAAAAPLVGRSVVGFSGSGGALVQVWDLEVEEPLVVTSDQPLTGEHAYVQALAAHAGGGLSLVDADGHVQRFGLLSGIVSQTALELPLKADDSAACFALSPGGSLAAVGSYQGAVALWSGLFAEDETQVVQLLQEGSARGPGVVSLAFSPGCSVKQVQSEKNTCQLAAAFDDGRLLLWGLDGVGPVTFEAPAPPLDLSFAPDGGSLAVATEAGVHILSLSDGAWGQSFPGYAAQFSPTGELTVSGGGPGSRAQIVIYDVATGTKIKTLDSSGGPLAFSPDGQLLAVSGVQVDVWQLNADPPVLLDRLPSFAPYGRITFSDDGTFLIAASWDGTVRIWGVR